MGDDCTCGERYCPIVVERTWKRLALLEAVVAALPKCSHIDFDFNSSVERRRCERLATWLNPQSPDYDSGDRDPPEPACDEHKGTPCPRGCCDPEELPYAAALRALMAAR